MGNSTVTFFVILIEKTIGCKKNGLVAKRGNDRNYVSKPIKGKMNRMEG